ncbi:hypothetical protein [Vibrio mediterranei]|uniref:hypothetical protein n=1 Tax=Vibrio mediterranei TaxID=689 RepID=UPI002284A1F8|nr:hypothetical protein [Vibrio mediterranei]MCY9853139.1 hypothetical protein [Vibrio mediterranei]
MKIGLKLATVAIPVPTVFWVIKGQHPKWVKVISVLWAMLTALMWLGFSQTENGGELFLFYTLSSLIWFGALNGLFILVKKVISKTKQKGGSAQINKQSNPEPSTPSERATPESSPSQVRNIEEEVLKDEPLTVETLTPRREKALYKLSLQILEDDEVDQEESKKLRAWLRRYPESKEDFRTKELYKTVEEVLEDKVLDSAEALELFALLSDFCDNVEKRESDKESQEKEKALQAQAKKLKAKPKASFTSVSSYSFLDDLKLGNEYFMSYADASGKASDRNIILNKVDVNQQDQHYIKAHCLLRNSQRTFRVDRIVALCDVDTGEALV